MKIMQFNALLFIWCYIFVQFAFICISIHLQHIRTFGQGSFHLVETDDCSMCFYSCMPKTSDKKKK